MPNPKKLTLKEALEITSRPAERFGDLISVQVDVRLENQFDFPSNEMRAIFAPSMDRSVAVFPQPETENYIKALYASGGRIESIAKFKAEDLALHFAYLAGGMLNSHVAGDAGDPSQFVADYEEAIGKLPILSPEVLLAVRKALEPISK